MQVMEEAVEDEDGAESKVCQSIMMDYKGPDGEDYVSFHKSLIFLFGSVLKGSDKEHTTYIKVLVSSPLFVSSFVCYTSTHVHMYVW